jgi:hypothetical protein
MACRSSTAGPRPRTCCPATLMTFEPAPHDALSLAGAVRGSKAPDLLPGRSLPFAPPHRVLAVLASLLQEQYCGLKALLSFELRLCSPPRCRSSTAGPRPPTCFPEGNIHVIEPPQHAAVPLAGAVPRPQSPRPASHQDPCSLCHPTVCLLCSLTPCRSSTAVPKPPTCFPTRSPPAASRPAMLPCSSLEVTPRQLSG